jgi:hypothetical protein
VGCYRYDLSRGNRHDLFSWTGQRRSRHAVGDTCSRCSSCGNPITVDVRARFKGDMICVGRCSFSTPRFCRRSVDQVADRCYRSATSAYRCAISSALRLRREKSYRSFSNVPCEHKQLSAIVGHRMQTESVHVVRGVNHRSGGYRYEVRTSGYRRYRNDCVGDLETCHVGHLSSILSEINRMICGVSAKYKRQLY